MKSSAAIILAVLVLPTDFAFAQTIARPPAPATIDAQLNMEGRFCFTLYTDSLIRKVSPEETKRRAAAVYAKPAAQDALANECTIFAYGVAEAKSMLRGVPYPEPRDQNNKDSIQQQAALSALRCHQMIKYELLYQRPTSDDDFMTSLGLSQPQKNQLAYDCKIYALGFKAGDGLLAMGMLK